MAPVLALLSGRSVIRDEETIFHPLMLDIDRLTFVAQSVTCRGMRHFKRLDKTFDSLRLIGQTITASPLKL